MGGDVLVVDDQEEVRAWIAQTLGEMDNTVSRVRQADSVKRAMAELDKKTPDVILLDVMLEDGSGFEVLENLRERQLATYVIVMTAFPQFDFAYQAANLQVGAFMVKPFSGDELKRRMLLALNKDMDREDSRQVGFTMLDSYLGGQRFSSGIREIWERTGIGRLQGEYYAVAAVSIEASRRIEARTHQLRALLSKMGDESVFYYRNMNTLIVILRSDAPERAMPQLDAALGGAFGWFRAGAAWLPHASGLRMCHDNAMFAFDCAREMGLSRQLLLYPQLDVAQIIVRKHLRGMADVTDTDILCSAVDAMILELARYCARPDSAALYIREGFERMLRPLEAELPENSLGSIGIVLKGEIERRAQGPDDPLLARVVDYIDRHYLEDITRASIAQALKISYSYLGEVFRAQYKEGLKSYIDALRLKHAAELLTCTNLHVDDVASSCGYQQPQQFARRFKQTYGVTPSDYRRARAEKMK